MFKLTSNFFMSSKNIHEVGLFKIINNVELKNEFSNCLNTRMMFKGWNKLNIEYGV